MWKSEIFDVQNSKVINISEGFIKFSTSYLHFIHIKMFISLYEFLPII